MKKKLIYLIFNLFLVIFLFQCNFQNSKPVSINDNKNMKVHYIDVDQGDSILVQVNSKNLLIDSGSSTSKDKLLKYLKSLNVNKFDYIVATHPHEDHIGNMSYVINKFKVSNFYAPKVESSTKAFETMVESLIRKNLKIKVLKANVDSIDLGENTKVEVFSPLSENYDDLNNYSPIIKISYGSTSFLFTGDAEEVSEKEVLNAGFNLKSDVLKIGHHGSSSSTSKNFFNEVNPSITVISVGNDNSYGHPTNKVLSLIEETCIYRTDKDGNIILTSDGNSIK